MKNDIKKNNDEKSDTIKKIEKKYEIKFDHVFHENIDGKDVVLRFGTVSQRGLLDIMTDVYGERV